MGRFCDLAILCPDMVPTDSKKIERYIWGLSPQIQLSVLASRPDTFDSAKELAQSLIDHGNYWNSVVGVQDQQKENNFGKQGGNKRKDESSQESSRKQHQGHTIRYCKNPARPINQLPNAGVSQACYGCGKVGHYKRDCPGTANTGTDGRMLTITAAGEATPNPR
ncbi:uncharacterized protein LOC111883713 [Lactuca sativa]|uniref:uncharacterized protein LOC111883713 n=1 Tax=Lactuca sativa TaxID=4236 RepID=UPI000CD8C596|nr:uncharacterized protein LOC111883713 [Lactuca sativa]